MAYGFNKVVLIGNLGKDPDVRRLEGNIAVANFPLATTETYKDKNGQRAEQTEWHNIVLWRAQAEYAEKYLRKGNTILIEGKLRSRTWQDKENNKRTITEIYGEHIQILIGNKKEDGTANHAAEQSNPAAAPDLDALP
jgi:single-strand DNA-binding protein